MATSRLGIWNMALDELPASRVDAMDDGSFEGEKLSEAYQPALELLLEDHDYDFAIVRQTLAVVTNGRAAEWAYAYQAPANMRSPRHMLPYGADFSAGSTPSYPVYGRLRSYEGIVPFRLIGGVIYANMENAIFEFVTSDVSEDLFSAKFARALALELASRVVMPIKKDSKRQGKLIQMAEIARERAKADDMNRDRESPRDFIPEAQLVRSGVLSWQ